MATDIEKDAEASRKQTVEECLGAAAVTEATAELREENARIYGKMEAQGFRIERQDAAIDLLIKSLNDLTQVLVDRRSY